MADAPLNDLLRCAIQVVGRLAMRPKQIGAVVATTAKHLKAYNLCDGTKGQSEVAKKAGLDQGNFSRSATRWVESGVLFKIGNGADAKLLHLYPLAKGDVKISRQKKSGARKRRGADRRKRARGRASR
jgi:hypothetical protein